MLYRDPANTIERVEPHPQINGRYVAKKSNLWAVRLGYWLGRGYSAKAVAEKLQDDTSEGTVKGQARRAGILPEKAREAVLPIHLPSWQRDAIAGKAAELGIEMEVLIVRVLESAVVLDDLYSAIVDGRYDQ